jgi:hypothetical protein
MSEFYRVLPRFEPPQGGLIRRDRPRLACHWVYNQCRGAQFERWPMLIKIKEFNCLSQFAGSNLRCRSRKFRRYRFYNEDCAWRKRLQLSGTRNRLKRFGAEQCETDLSSDVLNCALTTIESEDALEVGGRSRER